MVLYSGYDLTGYGPNPEEIYNENDCALHCIATFGCKGFVLLPQQGCYLKTSHGFVQTY